MKLMKCENQAERMTGVMISLAVNLHYGVSPPHVVPASTKIDSKAFCAILEENIYPTILSTTGANSTLQLDNAPSHHSRMTVQWLEEAKSSTGIGYIYQPANSPDLQPLDYYFWHELVRICGSEHKSRPALIGAIMAAVDKMNLEWDKHQAAISRQFSKRLQACIEQGGGYFEG